MVDGVREVADSTPVDNGASPVVGDTSKPPVAGLAPPPSDPVAPAAAVQAPGAKTLADGAVDADKPISTPAAFPDNWREQLTEDEKELKQLHRYSSFKDLWKKNRELEKRLSSGQLTAKIDPPGEGATPEEIAAYRKEVGVPESPDKYDTNLGDGFIWSDADKQILDGYTKWAHERNMTPDQVKSNLAWYASLQRTQAEQVSERDASFQTEAAEKLREEWGGEYRRNMNAISSLFSGLPADLRENLYLARTPDGKLVGDHPQFMRFWAQIARELNPAATLVPSNGGDPMKSVEGRIGEIENTIRNDRRTYDRDPAMQNEYRELLDAQLKMKARA